MSLRFAEPHYATTSLLLALMQWIETSPVRHLAILTRTDQARLAAPDRLAEELQDLLNEPVTWLDLPTELIDGLKSDIEQLGVHVALTKLIHALKQYRDQLPEEDTTLKANLRLLQQALNLAAMETDFLALAIQINTHEQVHRMAGKIDDDVLGAAGGHVPLLAATLEVSTDALQQLLRQDSPLIASGLLTLNIEQHSVLNDLDDILDILPGLERLAYERFTDQPSLMTIWLRRLEPSELTEADFPHLAAPLSFVRRYLSLQSQRRLPGINLLLHGEPGTGKTQLANLLSYAAGLTPYGVQTLYEEQPLPRRRNERKQDRFQAYRLAQQLLKNQPNALLVFDEAEDVFSSNTLLTLLGGKAQSNDGRKAWVNEQLESNPVPTIWITNHVSQIDPAYLRRFDFIQEVPVPPTRVRTRIIQRHWQPFNLPDSLIDQLAEYADIPPALYAKAARVVKALDLVGEDVTQALLQQINDWRSVHNRPPVRIKSQPDQLPYDIDLINAEPSAPFILRMLQRAQQASICFHGEPGTGKTAFAHHLAKELDKPLMLRRVSDLVSPYVGETEQNLARVFREAEREQAILFLDEGDSFLRDRSLAHHSWEVTQTNELLTQMEHYDGIFILATNRLDNLDPAAMRRFDFHVHFKSLTLEQKWRLFRTIVPQAGEKHRSRLDEMILNLGHFAKAWRQIRLAEVRADGVFLVQLLVSQEKTV